MILDCIKEGFVVAHKNLMLVLIRIAATVINLISIFFFLGIPLLVAIAYMGIDMAHARDLLPFLMENPFEFVSKYIGLVFLVGASIMFYLTAASMILLYVMGGTLGVVRNSAINEQYRFSFSSFFSEANQNFFRLMLLLSALLLGLMVLLIAFLTIGGFSAFVITSLAGSGSMLHTFISSFITVSTIIVLSLIFLVCFIVSAYSAVAAVAERQSVMSSIKKSTDLLRERPGSIVLCVVLFAGSAVLNIVIFGVKMPLGVIPVLGPMMSIAVSLLGAVFYSYAAVVIWASLTVYFLRSTDEPVHAADYEI
jgi:hypothetical protein